MYAQKDEKEFWLKWLDRYKSLQCLWDADAKRGVNKHERDVAYQELADLAKSVNPQADRNFVRRRINTFRTNYRREYKKVEAAKANGITYTPCLFYYDTLKQFVNPENDELEDSKILYDEESENDPISPGPKEKYTNRILKKDPTKNVLGNFLSYKFKAELTENEIVSKQRKTPASNVNKNDKNSNTDCVKASAVKRKYEPVEGTESVDCDDDDDFESSYQIENSYRKPLESIQDEYDILGKRIAEHFRNMKFNQRLFAEKIISDVCIYGRMERLTIDSTLVVESGEEDVRTSSDTVDYENPDTYIYNT